MSKFFRSIASMNPSIAILIGAAMISLALFSAESKPQKRYVDHWQLETKVFAATNKLEIGTQAALDNLQMEIDILKEANRLRAIHEASQRTR